MSDYSIDEKSILEIAQFIADSEAREKYLLQVCGTDSDLMVRVKEQLQFTDPTIAIDSVHRSEDSTCELQPRPDTGAGIEPHRQLALGDLVGGRYRLLKTVGQGGMGSVWLAEQLQPVQRKVAIKLIKPGMDSHQVLVRFNAERQALAMMDHPNIAKVLDGGLTEQGRPFFVMEYVPGVPLTRFCDEARMTIKERLEMFLEVCAAVQHAHQKGVIHRDLKPSNILAAKADGRPLAKVIDFGLAKAMHQPLTDQSLNTGLGSILGTPLYMSPEQADPTNLDIDTRTDIYSLGVILYELLAGDTPLDRSQIKDASYESVVKLIKEADPTKPSTRIRSGEDSSRIAAERRLEPANLQRRLSGDLDWIVMKALEKERVRRYETVNGLAADIQRHLNDEPVIAGPPTARYRIRKFVSRNRVAVSAASLVFAAILIAFVGTAYGLIRAQIAEADEKEAKESALKRLAQIEKGNEVLTSIFEDLDIRAVKEGSEPLEAVLASRLVVAGKSLDSDSVGDPVAVALMQAKLGKSLSGLGYPNDAIGLVTQSHATLREQLGRGDRETLSSLCILAVAHQRAGHLETALDLHLEARELAIAHLGPDHPDMPSFINNLAVCYEDVGQIEEAAKLLEEARELDAFHYGESAPDTLMCMANLAKAYQASGKLDECLQLSERTLELRRSMLGVDHPDTLTSLNNLGSVYSELGRPHDAITCHEEALERRKATLGSEHPETLQSMHNLALGHYDVGDLEQAMPMMEQVLKLRRKVDGATHPDTLKSMNVLALFFKADRQYDKAIPLYRETWELRKAILGTDHPNTMTTQNNLAMAYWDSGDHETALPLFESGLEATKSKLGPDHPDTIVAMNNLATGYVTAGRLNDALPLLEETLEITKGKLGPDHKNTLTIASNLASVYRQLKQPDKALPLVEHAFAAFKSQFGPNHPTTRAIQGNLGIIYLETNRPEDAIAQLEDLCELIQTNERFQYFGERLVDAYIQVDDVDKLVEFGKQLADRARQKSPQGSIELADALESIGADLVRGNAYADAETIFRESLAIREQLHPDGWMTYYARTLLGWTLLEQERFDEAEVQLLEGHQGLIERKDLIEPADRASRISESLHRLVGCYENWDDAQPGQGHGATANQWRQKLDEHQATTGVRSN